MRTIAILSHLFMIGLLTFVFFKTGLPEKTADWAWRIIFILLPVINLYILLKFKKEKRTK